MTPSYDIAFPERQPIPLVRQPVAEQVSSFDGMQHRRLGRRRAAVKLRFVP